MASISYRIFNNEEKDEYPTFSICFVGYRYGGIFHQSHNLFNSNNVTRESYYGYLMGHGKDYPTDSNTVEYDDVVLDIHQGYLMASGGRHVTDHAVQLDLVPTFRSPEKVCVSKTIVQRMNVKQFYDGIAINSSMLYGEKLWVAVYVHKEGQLIRDMATEGARTVIYGKKFKSGLFRRIDIGQVDVLRKRADGKVPCDQDMQDEDEYRMEQIIKSVGCIPTFWRLHAGRMGLNQTYPICTNTMDYGKVQTQLSNINDYISTLDLTQKLHCTTMAVSATVRDDLAFLEHGKLWLRFEYHGTSYREIINTKAYTRETLLGQIGGFVGMQYQFQSFD